MSYHYETELFGYVAVLKPRYLAQQAVIEAAKALYDCYTLEDQSKDFWKTDPVLSPRLASLFFKVEALQEVE